MELSKKELDMMSNFLRDKTRKRNDILETRFQKATLDFNAIVKMIVEKYSPSRIYQWGSLLNKKYFKEYSDIDIAVEGLKSVHDFFSLIGDAEKLTNFPLDIVELEKIHPIYREDIKKEGRLVYEKK